MNEDTNKELEQTVGVPLHRLVHIAYGLFAVGIVSMGVFGAATLAAVVLAYYKRADAVGTRYAAHFDWIIATFWWGALWLVISVVLTAIFIGWLTGLIAVVWIISRIMRGWLAHSAKLAPDSES